MTRLRGPKVTMSLSPLPPDGLRLREGQALDGLDLPREVAAALNAGPLVTVTPGFDGWRVTAGQVVGSVRCGDVDVRVTPKVGPAKVLALLARAHGVRGFRVDPGLLLLAEDMDLTEILAVLFEQEARDAFAQGPLRGYRTEDQSLPVVRGRLRVVEQETRRFGMLAPIEVTVDEWTMDTDDNRRIRAAVRTVLRLPRIPALVRTGLHRVDRMLTGVSDLAPGVVLSPWEPTRLNARQHRLLALTDLVLAGSGVEGWTGGVEARGFTLDMAWVFERLVERIFFEQCAAAGLTLVPQERSDLDVAGFVHIKPDLVVKRGRRRVAVADAKYKLLDDAGKLPNDDVYQLVTYCRRLGLSAGHLIYAADRVEDVHGRLSILGADVDLVVHAVHLADPLEQVVAQLEQISADALAVRRRIAV